MSTILSILLLVVATISTLAAFGGEAWEKDDNGKWLKFRINRRGWISLTCLALTLGLGIYKEVTDEPPLTRKDIGVGRYKSGDTSGADGIAIQRGTLKPLTVLPEETIEYQFNSLEEGNSGKVSLVIDGRPYVLHSTIGSILSLGDHKKPMEVHVLHPAGVRIDLTLIVVSSKRAQL